MTLGELRDKLANISDETELEVEVWIAIDDYNSRKIKDVYTEFDTGEVILK